MEISFFVPRADRRGRQNSSVYADPSLVDTAALSTSDGSAS